MPSVTIDEIKRLIIILLVIAVLFYLYKTIYKNDILNTKLADVPHSIKCFFEESSCEKGDIDWWTVIQFIVFVFIGLVAPKHYWLVILFSILYEIVKAYFGQETRFIINPLVNITAYTIGSLISPYKTNNYQKKYQILTL